MLFKILRVKEQEALEIWNISVSFEEPIEDRRQGFGERLHARAGNYQGRLTRTPNQFAEINKLRVGVNIRDCRLFQLFVILQPEILVWLVDLGDVALVAAVG